MTHSVQAFRKSSDSLAILAAIRYASAITGTEFVIDGGTDSTGLERKYGLTSAN